MGRLDDVFWAQFLGIDSDEWNLPGISYRVHVGLSGYQGFWCFRKNDRVVVSVPSRWLERLEVLLSGWDQDRLMTCEALAEALGADLLIRARDHAAERRIFRQTSCSIAMLAASTEQSVACGSLVVAGCRRDRR